MKNIKESWFSELQGLQLSSVEFVQDYFQLRFDGPCITTYNPTKVECGDLKVMSWGDQFRNMLCGQIGKIVNRIEFFEKDVLLIMFEDQSRITISLKEEDYSGPEAIKYIGLKKNNLVVI